MKQLALAILLLAPITLVWDYEEDAVRDHYTLYQVKMPCAFIPGTNLQSPLGGHPGGVIQTLPADATSATVAGLIDGAWYCWTLVAMSSTGISSGFNSKVCRDFNTTKPPAPTGLRYVLQ